MYLINNNKSLYGSSCEHWGYVIHILPLVIILTYKSCLNCLFHWCFFYWRLSVVVTWCKSLAGPSWRACFRPPLVLPPYMVMTSARRWSVFARTWACVHSTTSYLTSWVWRSTCGSIPDSKAWRRKTYAKRWTSQYKSTALHKDS